MLALVAVTTLAACGGGAYAGPGTSSIVGVNVNGPHGPKLRDTTPHALEVRPPAFLHGSALATFREGETLAAQAGCLGCHVIGADGNDGPGPPLTHIGALLSEATIIKTLRNPTAPMPSFAHLPRGQLHALAAFLADLRAKA